MKIKNMQATDEMWMFSITLTQSLILKLLGSQLFLAGMKR